MQPIILASQSPRRKQLLEWAEIPFVIDVQHTDEYYPASTPVHNVPVYIARNKAKAVLESNNQYNNSIILAADTIVVLNNTIIGKPENENHAIEILKQLSGKKHQVITGVVLLQQDREVSFEDVTEVEFHTITKEQIEWYVAKYKPYDKAGAYAIQEWIGVIGIKSISGDFYNVMGLPVSRVIKALDEFKIK